MFHRPSSSRHAKRSSTQHGGCCKPSLAALLVATLSFSAQAQRPEPPSQGPLYSGYLCCNMRTTGKKITDINYDESGKTMLAAGTPLAITAYGYRSIDVSINGQDQRLMNDYSRDLSKEVFAQRYVVKEDPRAKIQGFPDNIRQAILDAKVVPGMSREQVVMAVGYPVTSENPEFNAKLWRFWLDSWIEFQVQFDDNNQVKEVKGEPAVLSRVTYKP